ncbi:hypothetical protein MTO96_049457 [Rhipicephalus appendiculatus]
MLRLPRWARAPPLVAPDSGGPRHVLARPRPRYVEFEPQDLPAGQLLSAFKYNSSQPRSHLGGAASFGRGSWLACRALTKPSRLPVQRPATSLRGAVSTAKTAGPEPPPHPSAAATPEASSVGPVGLRVCAKRGLLPSKSSEQRYWLRRVRPPAHAPSQGRVVPGQCATPAWRPLSTGASGSLSVERCLGAG